MATPNNHHPPSGLGSPLVTVSNVPGTNVSGIRPSNSGSFSPPKPTNEHPLAGFAGIPTTSSHKTTAPTIAAMPSSSPTASNSFNSTASVSTSSKMTVSSTHPSVSTTTRGIITHTNPSPPSVSSSSKIGAPLKKTLDNLADSFLSGPSYRLAEQKLPPLLKPPPLPHNETGIERLQTLVERRAWGDVLQISGDMLRSASSPHAPIYTSLINNTTNSDDPALAKYQHEMIEILTLECHAWLKLRRYADLGREMERWSFCRVNDVTAVSPSWVPWSVHILAAESLQYTDPTNPQRCTDELYSLRERLNNYDTNRATSEDDDAAGQIEDDDNDRLRWMLRIDSALSNAFLRQRDYRMALDSLDHMLELLPRVFEFEGEELMGHQVEVISRQGRILLQVGALSAAGALFDRVKHMAENLPPSPMWMIQRIPAQLATNEGLLAFANTQYEPAMAAFKNSIDVLRTCQPSQGAVYHRDAFMGPVWVDTHADLLTVCWNNMALSALYTCRMKEAVRMMESVVREDPTSYLTERLAFNLCTLYELGADTTTSSRKKRVLQLVAKRFYLHDIGPESFRVS